MAAVSQVIPNYVQGISNQPDQLKIPGQVRDLKNAWPDVTRGCMKRPGSKHIAELGVTPGGTWFSIDRGRDPSQQFIGNLKYTSMGNPQLYMWDLNGKKQNILYADTPYEDSFSETQLTDRIENANSCRQYLTPIPNAAWSPYQERAGVEPFHNIKVYQGDGKTFFLNDHVVPDFSLTEESKTILTSADQFTDESKFNPNNYFESYLSLRQVQYQREYLLAFDDPLKNDADSNIQYKYAMAISDTRFRGKNPDNRKFDEDEVNAVCQLEMAYQRFTIDADEACFSYNEDMDGEELDYKKWKSNEKIVVHSVKNQPGGGENLEISLEVVCRAVQKIDRHSKNPAKDEYYWISEYKERVQLLNGGRNWRKGDKIILGYRPDENDIDGYWDDYLDKGRVKIEITIGESGKQTIMADIGFVSVLTNNNDSDTESTPFASANDIIYGLCHGLEKVGATPLIYNENGDEVPATEKLYENPPATVEVQMGSADQTKTEDVAGEPNTDPFLEGLGIEFKPIGNGIYFRKKPELGDGPSPFKLVTPEEQLFNHMSTKEVNEWYCTVHAVSRLPNQCRHNLKVKVMNTEDNDADDYYIKFVGHDSIDGEGSWEECVKPGYGVKPKFSSMPHELVYVPSRNGSWVVTPVEWAARSVGDEKTAEAPAFLQKTIHPETDRAYEFDTSFSKTITGMAWYRNRMILFSDKNISMSVDGDYYNFWPKTARAVSDEDGIEITAVAKMPSPIVESIEMAPGLVLFGKDEQFLLTTDADGMRPGTTKVMAISQYNYNVDVPPVKMGQNIAFLSDAGLNDKLFEMSQVSREGTEPQVIELSKLVEPRLPDNIDLLTASKSNMAVFLTKYWGPSYLFSPQNTQVPDCDGNLEDDKFRLFNNEKFREVWGYRYYDNGQKRVQSAWFRWTFDLPIAYHVCIDDNYYVVLFDDSKTYLRKIGLKHEDELYPVFLDGYVTQCPSDTCFSLVNGDTIFYPNEWHFVRDRDCIYVELYNKNDLIESYKCGESFQPTLGSFATVLQNPNRECDLYVQLPGDWTSGCEGKPIDCDDPLNPWRVTIGKPYDMVVDLPTPYVGKKEGDSYQTKWDPHLTLHRLKFSVGPSSMYDTLGYRVEVKRKSREKQNAHYDVTFDYPQQTEETFTHPIFMRNTDVDIKFICSDPHGGILYSMQWEGDFNPKWYKYV